MLLQSVLPHCSISIKRLLSAPRLILILLKFVLEIRNRIIAYVGNPVIVAIEPLKEPEPLVPAGTVSQV